MWLRNRRAVVPLMLVVSLLAGQAEAGETRATLRVSARVVERCTFATRVPAAARAHELRPRDLVDMRCGRSRPARVTVRPFVPAQPTLPRPVQVRRGTQGQHLQVTITY